MLWWWDLLLAVAIVSALAALSLWLGRNEQDY